MAESTIPVRRSIDGKRAHVRRVETSAASQLAGPPPAPQPGVEKLNDDLRAAMSREPDPQMLKELARHENVIVVREVAQNLSTDPDTLDVLARSVDSAVRECTADSPRVSQSTLHTLAGDADFKVRHAVAANHSTSFDTLFTLTRDRSKTVRESAVDAVLRVGSLPGAELTAEQLQRVEVSTTLPDAVKEHIRARAEHDALSAKIGAMPSLVAAQLAAERDCPATALDILADYPHELVQAQVAGNARTSAGVLDRLADPHRKAYVRCEVAESANADERTFMKLARDPDRAVRDALLGNLHVGLAPLRVLAGSPSAGERRAAREVIEARELEL